MLRDLPTAVMGPRRLLGARIVFNNRVSIFDCVVRNLAESGAVLRMFSTLGVPPTFQLHIKSSDTWIYCEVADRTETELRVIFPAADQQVGRPAAPNRTPFGRRTSVAPRR